ncbi:hypothetical protein K3M67_19570 (plasmid) [Sphingobium sp. V4]|uniref:hypothetical protein n=1 Tax=Sphingobium sp. V4 TaxID=3038927 RepID=UPI002557F62C|nr:hypothetical protein [Sphingobium sp. V4]WIW90250.1 hypothetical protein K3M67_19570 [Sphingobium sp. V4]
MTILEPVILHLKMPLLNCGRCRLECFEKLFDLAMICAQKRDRMGGLGLGLGLGHDRLTLGGSESEAPAWLWFRANASGEIGF